MQKGHGQDTYQTFGSQRPVAEPVEAQVELEVDEKGSPNEHKAADGDNQGLLNATPVCL